jgi:NADH-quinone oxidoreductase subunit H
MNTYLAITLWGAGAFLFIALFVLVLEYIEMKLAGHIQHRIAFLHTGWHGVLQPIADMIKFLAKEHLTPRKVSRFIYLCAPFVSMIPPYLAFLVLPLLPGVVALRWDLALLYVIAVPSLAVLGPLMAGWGSNNKYSFIGGLRAVTQIVSYEIPRLLAVVSVIVLAGSLDFEKIVKAQNIPYLIWLPLGFLVFFIASLMEINRIPFDLAEDESTLIMGFHTEYVGIRWGLFMMAEYAHLILAAFLATYLFLSGWRGPWIPDIVWLFIKVFGLIFVMIWVRWTFPRFRPDQMMDFAWKVLFPLSIINFIWAVIAAVVI